jgi:SAM-dependent methyltransferase
MEITNIYIKIERYLKKMPISFCLLIIIVLMFILIYIYKIEKPVQEGFINNQKEDFLVKKGIELFDDFYVSIYDELFFKELVNEYEIGSISNITKPTNESNMLIIGSGTGHITDAFNKEGIKVTGLDESKSMIKYSKNEYPSINFINDSPKKSMLFNEKHFTHILCLNMTMYYYKDKKQFLQNVYNWLMPGGYFVVQLVDKNKFDPVVPAAKPFILVNPQSVSEKRITKSTVIFNNFDYKSDFQVFPNDFVQFKETFKDNSTSVTSPKTRQNIHKMWIPSKISIINMAKETGFITFAQVDLLMAQMEYQYLYVFQKPA